MTEPATDQIPPCPECASEYTYESGSSVICPMCGHEWVPGEAESAEADAASASVVKDAVGNVLSDGDDVSVVKSLKVKGGGAIKIGTKVTNIRLLEDPVDGHDIDAKVPGAGQMYLKSSVVKKL
ncbi:phosphonoacetate hydrolase [Corynebacterium xerosis]|jgi:protein PhnA|uniref:zinc ribbon domain-containing protein YjdM n=1 Tax=Corynebacterium TaxID=1716 RepID=UPI000627DAFC|nr:MULTISPECIES: zinc ribbon domain-containing protein YjdM [Corynebacterium]KKO82574.1 phosphonoacetate hydrolase [Corynebacterium xerosis]SQB96512.1 alkylphosphonate utilization protein PhnA [Clostridium paraputrificum]HHT31302.1 alkylphosphonate utilization protein [Corynebacterium sp.]HJG57648.1 alkylphosphonate utilization protein [Corynebacterium xerosis]